MNREPDPDVATAIELTAMCRMTQKLPRAGGVLDQDSLEMYILYNTWMFMDERAELDRKQKSSGH